MKRIYIYAMAVAAMMTVSCSKEFNDVNGVQSVPVEPLTLSVSSEEAVSKTSLDGKRTVWCGGESISVFSCEAASPVNHEFVMSGEPSGSSAKFAGEVEEGTENIVAVYPYSAGNSYAAGVVNAVVPVQQTATAGSFADGASLLYYKGAKEDGISFKSVCSIIYFTLPADITFASSVTISANNGAKIAGKCTVAADGSLTVDAAEGSATVVLNGSFEGGKKYYATIAPGSYEGGFSFAVATAAGNSYLRTNALDMTLEANAIHNLGTLALLLDSAMFSAQATVTHDIEGGKLNGSTVKARVNLANAEFASAVSGAEWTASLKLGDTVVRTVSGTGFNADVVMSTVDNGYYYLPAGSYDLEITGLSYMSAGKKRILSGLVCSASGIPAVAPAAGTLNVQPQGYTSYSTYKGLDGRTASVSDANNENGSTIYGVGCDCSSAFSSDVLAQCSSMISASATLDGAEASGDVAGQSWAKHTIEAAMTFDGVSHSASKDVHVTGLPYSANSKSDFNNWAKRNTSWNNDGYLKIHDGVQMTESYARLSSLYVPNDINVAVHSKYAAGFATVSTNLEIYVSGTKILEFKGKGGAANTGGNYGESINDGSISSSNSLIECKNTYNAGGSHCRLYFINVNYR